MSFIVLSLCPSNGVQHKTQTHPRVAEWGHLEWREGIPAARGRKWWWSSLPWSCWDVCEADRNPSKGKKRRQRKMCDTLKTEFYFRYSLPPSTLPRLQLWGCRIQMRLFNGKIPIFLPIEFSSSNEMPLFPSAWECLKEISMFPHSHQKHSW